MPLQDLLKALTMATAIVPIWKFFLQRWPRSEQQRLMVQVASKQLPQADTVLQKGWATRHQYRQALIVVARARRHS